MVLQAISAAPACADPLFGKLRRIHSEAFLTGLHRLFARSGLNPTKTLARGCAELKGARRASVRDFHRFRVTWITLALAAEVPLELVQRVTGHKTVEAVPTPDKDTVAALDEITGIPKGVPGKANQARVEKALELLKTVTASLTGEPEVARA